MTDTTLNPAVLTAARAVAARTGRKNVFISDIADELGVSDTTLKRCLFSAYLAREIVLGKEDMPQRQTAEKMARSAIQDRDRVLVYLSL